VSAALATSLPPSLLAIEAEACVPTRHGAVRMIVFRWGHEHDHVALVWGDVQGDDVLVRVHSACMTCEVFGALTCPCAEQLDQAQALAAAEGRGVLVYLRQEGRGIGLANKMRVYSAGPVGAGGDAALRRLGLPHDARRYDAAAAFLRALGVRSVRLLTNNPGKIHALEALGITVNARIPSAAPAGPEAGAHPARSSTARWRRRSSSRAASASRRKPKAAS
jgi:GTP cyclohydrolase II